MCNKIIESLSKNDGMKYCSCGAIAVYGGKEAIMRLGHHRDIEDMSIKVFEAEHPSIIQMDNYIYKTRI